MTGLKRPPHRQDVFAEMDESGRTRYFADEEHTVPSDMHGNPIIGGVIATATSSAVWEPPPYSASPYSSFEVTTTSSSGPITSASDSEELRQLRKETADQKYLIDMQQIRIDNLKSENDDLTEGLLKRSQVEEHIAEWLETEATEAQRDEKLKLAEHYVLIAEALRNAATNRRKYPATEKTEFL